MENIKRLSIVVAHPDDEALGCAGTILKLKKLGTIIQIIFLTNGVSSRIQNNDEAAIKKRDKSCDLACKAMNIDEVKKYNFLDNQLDQHSNLEITRVIEKDIFNFKPDSIFTHSYSDLNIDHQCVYRAVMTAARPVPNISVKRIFTFEVPSSTNWMHSRGDVTRFNPQHFEDISEYIEEKISVLSFYDQEIREAPHARSLTSIEALARFRGSEVGLNYAEAFEVIRSIA